MTKKDYVNLANGIKDALNNPNHFYVHSGLTDYQNGVLSVAVSLANHVLTGNPKFNKERFLKACGMSEGDKK